MMVYAVAQITIHDRVRYDRYAAKFLETLGPYQGRLLAADEHPEMIEGSCECHKVILLAFPDASAFHAWRTSPEYEAIAIDRLAASSGSVLLVRGL
ncbi:DUF1330 domain-containing protein [Rhizobium sp. L1K21]|uniref:DUF1330 domain-containing protein n=1 Tax=Rhizobium sp. L1K21 TaxID=2954933 RepID=UPI002093878F|nr:DUF1330 domain-containing protein [Rhizobium sp. L1K21]MCO6187305.1 DUF1330 domain-containing protein [Rhizobium sp. L1K21]